MKKSIILLSAAALLSLAACGTHTHTFASEWTYDDTNHWHAATCEHTDQKDGVAAHTLGADGKCTVCDYKQQPSYTKMTEEQFNALVNKIQTQGIAAQFDLLAKAGDVVLAKEKASFKFDIASTSLEELSYNDTGAVVDGSILKDLTEYEFKSGGWTVGNTLTEQQAKQTLGHELEGMAEQFFPSQTYADYNFDETTGKYTVDLTNEQQVHIVYVYTMDASRITKIEGTTTGEYGGVAVVSSVTTSSVNVGPQTITTPQIDVKNPYKVTEQEFLEAKNFNINNNFEMKLTTRFEGETNTKISRQAGNKSMNFAPGSEDWPYYLERVDGSIYLYLDKFNTGEYEKTEEQYFYLPSEELAKFCRYMEYDNLVWDETNNYYLYNFVQNDIQMSYSVSFYNGKFVKAQILNDYSSITSTVYISVEVSKYGEISFTLPEVYNRYKVTPEQFALATNFGTEHGQINNFEMTMVQHYGPETTTVNMLQTQSKAKYITDSRTHYLSIEDGIRYLYLEENIGEEDWKKDVDTSSEVLPTENLSMQLSMLDGVTDDDYDEDLQAYVKEINEGSYQGSTYILKFEDGVLVNVHFELGQMSIDQTISNYGEVDFDLPEPTSPDADAKYKVTSEQYDAATSVEAFNNVSIYDFYNNLLYKFDGDNEEAFSGVHSILSHEDNTWYIYRESGGSWSRVVTQNPSSEREDLVSLLSCFDYDSLEYDKDSHSYMCIDDVLLSYFEVTQISFGFEDGVLQYLLIQDVQLLTFADYGTTVIDIPIVG